MLKQFVEKIESMSGPRTYEVDGRHYSDEPLRLIEAPRYSPTRINVSGINSLVALIKQEINNVNAPVFVEVIGHNKIDAYSTYNDRYERQDLYRAISDVPCFDFGWREYDAAMIAFRSQFIQNEGTEYILDLLSRITDENSVASTDNGLSQTVEVKQGIAMKSKENIKPIIKLTPYRTFLEVQQPESEFLLRVKEGGQIGLFEADGGMWKLQAKKIIAARLEEDLRKLIANGKVVVML